MPTISPTDHQRQAIEWVCDRIHGGSTLVALRGLAGTGKTSCISFLRELLNTETCVGCPTHRAAVILKQKGITDADTIHALALAPVFAAPYVLAQEWCQQVSVMRFTTADMNLPLPIPDLIMPILASSETPTRDTFTPQDIIMRCQRYPPEKVLASFGIHAKDYLIGFGPRAPQPHVLIIDEGSMVGSELLGLAQQVFRRIIIIGDPGQLPPVKDTNVLETIEGVQLSEIHRQAQESGIIRAAYALRQGTPVWRRTLAEYAPEVASCAQIPATAFLTAPLIVWRNQTRIDCTKAIRKALGYPEGRLVEGEPVVCRSNDKNIRILGLYNNALFTIAKVISDREVVLKDSMTGEEVDSTLLLHVEEEDGNYIDADATVFRYAYCLTAHTAQGGEWPQVFVSVSDLNAYAGMAVRNGTLDDIAKWSYTAATRAKESLVFLTAHNFTRGE